VVLMNYFEIPSDRIGIYYLATGLGNMLTFVFAGIGPLALSLFSESYTRGGASGLSRAWRQIIGFTFFCTAPIYLYAFIHAESLIGFVYGSSFAEAHRVFAWYLGFLFLSSVLGDGFAVATLYVVGRNRTALLTTLEGSVLNVGLNLVLIPRFGEMGAVIATGSAMLYMAVRRLAVLSKDLEVGPVFPFLGKCFLLSLTAGIPSYLLEVWVTGNPVVTLAGYAGGFVLLLYLVKPLGEEHKKILAGIHPGLGNLLRGFVRAPANPSR